MFRALLLIVAVAVLPRCSGDEEPLGPGGASDPEDTGASDTGVADADGSVSVPQGDAGPPLLADSEADFSGVQGRGGWLYGYIEPSTSPSFQFMQVFGPSGGQMKWFVDADRFWTALSATGGHPNGTQTPNAKARSVQHVVRRWQSNVEGDIRIFGRFEREQPSDAGNGILAEIRVDGQPVWSERVRNVPSWRNEFNVTASVQLGTAVDFYVDAQEDDGADGFLFRAQILRVP